LAFARRQELRARGWAEFPKVALGAGYSGSAYIDALVKFAVPHEALSVPARGRLPASWHLFAPRAVVVLLRDQMQPLNYLVEDGLRRAGQLAPAKQDEFFAAAAAAIALGASPLDTFGALT
jgi:hypothetical protein